jgi:TolB-like protein
MKKAVVFSILAFFPVIVFSQSVLTIDAALSNSTSYFSGRIQAKTKVVVLNFTSKWPDLSDYIIEELIGYIVNEGKLTVVDRQNLESIRKEMDFQLSGEVSDETAQSIGKKLGAQTIMSGAITAIGNAYRLRIRAISVETAQILGMQNVDVAQDSRIAALTGTGYTGPAAVATTTTAPSAAAGANTPAASGSSNNISSNSIAVFAGNGHRYEVINSSYTWIRASDDCEKRGGYLATITSPEEQKFIEELISKQGKRNNYWLGGYREGKEWKWVNGESFIFKNWMPGEPNNSNGREDKLMLARNTPVSGSKPGQWNDSRNDDINGGWGPFSFICEWD